MSLSVVKNIIAHAGSLVHGISYEPRNKYRQIQSEKKATVKMMRISRSV